MGRAKNYGMSALGTVIPGAGAIAHGMAAEDGEGLSRGLTAGAGGMAGGIAGAKGGFALAKLLKKKNPLLLASLLAAGGGTVGGGEAATLYDKYISKRNPEY